MIDNRYLLNIPTIIQDCAVCIHMLITRDRDCMQMQCLFGHQHGGHKVTKTSVTEFFCWSKKLFRTLESQHIEINTNI